MKPARSEPIGSLACRPWGPGPRGLEALPAWILEKPQRELCDRRRHSWCFSAQWRPPALWGPESASEMNDSFQQGPRTPHPMQVRAPKLGQSLPRAAWARHSQGWWPAAPAPVAPQAGTDRGPQRRGLPYPARPFCVLWKCTSRFS